MEKIHLVFPQKIGTISPRLYGAFIEHLGSVVYDGIYCGECRTYFTDIGSSAAYDVWNRRTACTDSVERAVQYGADDLW